MDWSKLLNKETPVVVVLVLIFLYFAWKIVQPSFAIKIPKDDDTERPRIARLFTGGHKEAEAGEILLMRIISILMVLCPLAMLYVFLRAWFIRIGIFHP